MIKASELIVLFERMRDEKWIYTWGAAKEGNVDCSGAFVWAFAQYGQKIPHGSNSIGHKNVITLLPISEAKPGMAVFRCKEWTDSEDDQNNNYYQVSPGNLFHIGLVGRNGNTVLEAKGGRYGFVESKLNKTWAYCGYLKRVDYSEEIQNGSDFGMNDWNIGRVSITSGYVNLRSEPNVTSKVVSHLYEGTMLKIDPNYSADKWYKVIASTGAEGYVYKKYVTIDEKAIGDGSNTSEAVVQFVITDSAGNAFHPTGPFTVKAETSVWSGSRD